MKVFIGTDHNGFQLRNSLVQYLKRSGYQVEDEGDKKLDPVDDYPIFAQRTVNALLASNDPEPRGILLCGSGQGVCMAANRYKGIRAALACDRESVRASRNDDDANVLCIPAQMIKESEARVLVETFLNTPFAGAERFKRRIRELDEL